MHDNSFISFSAVPLVKAENVTVREDAGTVTINVTREGDIGTTTSVSIATDEGSATGENVM